MSVNFGLSLNCCINSDFALLSSFISSLNNEMATGLPPKFAPPSTTNFSAPIISPVLSLIIFAISGALISWGLFSLSRRNISNDAVDEPPISPNPLTIDILSAEFPIFFWMCSINARLSSCIYFSSNSLPISIAWFSMTLIIESVTFTFVPIGIFRSTVTASLSIIGKKVTPIIPPKTELIVK